jgi:HK97 gp10 family phage protein
MEGLDEYMKKLTDLGASVEGSIKRAVYPAAGMVIEAIKANTPVDTGGLRDSAALRTFKNEDGYVFTQVTFEGYDEKGHPNPVKARVLESGSSTRKKHPFIRPAVNRVKAQAEGMIAAEFVKICEEKMNS